MNTSKLIPVGHKILVLPDKVEQTTESGIITTVGEKLKQEELAQTEGVLVAIGNNAWSDQKEPWAKVGDRVIFAKYAGHNREGRDGKLYRILNDLDIGAVILGEENE